MKGDGLTCPRNSMSPEFPEIKNRTTSGTNEKAITQNNTKYANSQALIPLTPIVTALNVPLDSRILPTMGPIIIKPNAGRKIMRNILAFMLHPVMQSFMNGPYGPPFRFSPPASFHLFLAARTWIYHPFHQS
jgi:hypothetical protein